MHTYIRTYINNKYTYTTHTCSHTHTYAHTYTHSHTYTHIQKRKHLHTYTHSHTHLQANVHNYTPFQHHFSSHQPEHAKGMFGEQIALRFIHAFG